MHILSEGVPMTNGEVYALLRRRRDERSAGAHLPFGLQRAQADPHSRTSHQAVQYTRSSAGAGGAQPGSGDGAQRQPISAATGPSISSGASWLLGPTSADVDAMNAMLASPAAGHLAVLLTEVRVLHYLSQHTVMPCSSGSDHTSMRAVYGPSTVYDLSVSQESEEDDDGGNGTHAETVKTERDAGNEPPGPSARKKTTTRKASAVKREADDEADKKAALSVEEEEAVAERLMREAITHTLVGSKRHVRCVGCALAYYEARGRRQERAWAQEVRRVVAEAQRRYRDGIAPSQPPAAARSSRRGSGASRPAIKHEPESTVTITQDTPRLGEADDEEQEAANRHRYFAPSSVLAGGTRPLLRPPPNLVDVAVADFVLVPPSSQKSGGPPAAPTSSASSSALPPMLSDVEVMLLVMARPTTPLQVHQLIDNLDGRFNGDEAAVEHFQQAILHLFRQP